MNQSIQAPSQTSLNILILYDDWAIHTNTVIDYLNSFALFSKHNIFYAVATNNATCSLNLSSFDVVAIHYSVRLCYDWHLSPSYAEALSKFGGFKLLFIQDEYENTETTRCWIEKLGLHAVFTCVPTEYVDLVYPSVRFPHVEFVQVLTGYVPIRYEVPRSTKPLAERTFLIGYRGRALPPRFGHLAREKLIIGQRMRQICEERGINVSIEWEEDKRIYGEKWDEFIEDCKATLGTESGSNIFDDDGEISKTVAKALEQNPELSYEEIHAKYLAEHEGRIVMNQVSPRIFEAIVHKTALVLFEGTYSGVVKPDLHYIPLKKDFSNVDEVLEKLSNDHYLEELTERAYADVVKTGQYSYHKFVQDFDHFVSQRLSQGNEIKLVAGVVGSWDPSASQSRLHFDPQTFSFRTMLTTMPLHANQINTIDTTLVPLLENKVEPLQLNDKKNEYDVRLKQLHHELEVIQAESQQRQAEYWAERQAERIFRNAERKKWFILMAFTILIALVVTAIISTTIVFVMLASTNFG